MKKKEISSRQGVRVLNGRVQLIVCIAIVAALVVIGFVGDNNIRRILIRMFLYCAMAVVWNLMSGYTGMTSLGQQAFVGIAGYSMAVMTSTCGGAPHAALRHSFDLCSTPKRCCSSIIASPRFRNTTLSSIRACVPTIIPMLPSSSPA